MTILQTDAEVFADYAEHLRRKVPESYLPPRFVWLSEESGADAYRHITADNLVQRIGDELAPQTWYVRGYPGSGKTSFCHHFAAALLSRGVAAIVLRPQTLSHIAAGTDVREFIKSCRPSWIAEEKLWTARARKGRIVLIIDSVHDIERWYHGTDVAKLVERLLFGSHSFPVVATSRRELESSESGDALRDVNHLVLGQFDDDDQAAYLQGRGVDPVSGLKRLAAAGLSHAATNPFLLALATTLLSEQRDQELARTRAGLFAQTLRHAETAFSREEVRLLSTSPGPQALLAATAVNAAFQPQRAGTFTHAEITALLRKLWPDDELAKRVDVFLGSYLVSDAGLSAATRSAPPRYQFIHESIIDFGVALAYRTAEPPLLAFSAAAGLDNLLGDWVGLQDDAGRAIESVVRRAETYARRDLLVDVAIANRGVLSDASLEALWTAVGNGLISSRRTRDSVSQKLGLLPRAIVRESMTFGLLRPLHRNDPALCEIVRRLLEKGVFGADIHNRHRRWLSRRSRSRTNDTRGSVDVGRFIVELSTHVSPNIRARAAFQLGQVQASAAVEPLLRALADAESGVRGRAANALGRIGDEAAVPALAGVLRDQVDIVRGSAATALGQIGDRSAVVALTEALKDQAHNVRGSAATALGRIGDRSAVPALTEALKDEAHNVRGSAATALGQIGDRAAVVALTEALKDGAADVRGSAATALGQIGDRAAVVALTESLKDEAAHVRGSAATALGQIGDRSVVVTLTETLKDHDAHTRGSAATALGQIGDRSVVVTLTEALKDEDAYTRGSAATALKRTGERSVVDDLLACVEDEGRDELSRAAMLDAVLQLVEEWPPRLEQIVQTEQRAIALPRPVKGKLIEGLSRFTPSLSAIRWLDKTARYDSDPASRTAAVRALAGHGKLSESTIRYLIDPAYERRDKRRHDSDWGVQGQTAAVIVQQFAGGGEPAPDLLRILIDLLTEENIHQDVLTPALQPLSAMSDEDAARALRVLEQRTAGLESAARLRQFLERQRTFVEQRRALSQALRAAQSDPAGILLPLREADDIWFDKQESGGMNLGSAILVTSNEREGRVVYQALCEACGVEQLALEPVGTRYVHHAILHCHDMKPRSIRLAQLHDIGPLAAQSAFHDLVGSLAPRLVLFVGCCGGLPEKSAKAARGTVFVPRQVFDYERRTLHDGATRYSEPAYRTPRQLLDLIRALAVAGRFGELNVVTNKDYASGSAFIDDPAAPLRQDLLNEFPKDVLVVDMEAHAVLHAFWESGASSERLMVGIVKAISDDSSGDGDVDEAARQQGATRNAVNVALTILRSLPE